MTAVSVLNKDAFEAYRGKPYTELAIEVTYQTGSASFLGSYAQNGGYRFEAWTRIQQVYYPTLKFSVSTYADSSYLSPNEHCSMITTLKLPNNDGTDQKGFWNNGRTDHSKWMISQVADPNTAPASEYLNL